eukprot:4171098-Pyramimonas_sp.AAC.1
MRDSKFILEARMGVLEVLVKPAKIDPLRGHCCSICALRIQLAGSDQGLGDPDSMEGLQYIEGGTAMFRRRLDHDRPAAPAPGVLLTPPRVVDGRFASTGLKEALFNCD